MEKVNIPVSLWYQIVYKEENEQVEHEAYQNFIDQYGKIVDIVTYDKSGARNWMFDIIKNDNHSTFTVTDSKCDNDDDMYDFYSANYSVVSVTAGEDWYKEHMEGGRGFAGYDQLSCVVCERGVVVGGKLFISDKCFHWRKCQNC